MDNSNRLCKPLLLLDPQLPPDTGTLSLYKNNSSRKAHQLVLQGETPRLTIQATNFGQSQTITSASSYNYALAVIDVDSEGEAERIEILDAEVLVCKRYIKALSGHYLADNEVSPTEQMDYKTARNLLGETFGTKKQRTAITSMERNQIDFQGLRNTSSDFISKAIQERAPVTPPDSSRPDTPAPSQTLSGDEYAQLLPPHNPNTTEASEIYTIDQLIPVDIQEALPATSFSDDTHLNELPPFIAEKMRLAIGSKERVMLVLFLHYLLAFRNMREVQINSKSTLLGAMLGAIDTTTLSNFMLTHFAENVVISVNTSQKTRYKLPNTRKDRLNIWIAITMLLLDNFRTNVTQLSLILLVSPMKMAGYFRSAGCLVEKPSKGEPLTILSPDGRALQIKWARLRAPLNLPKPSTGKRKNTSKS